MFRQLSCRNETGITVHRTYTENNVINLLIRISHKIFTHLSQITSREAVHLIVGTPDQCEREM
jgi:hypothetical protein